MLALGALLLGVGTIAHLEWDRAGGLRVGPSTARAGDEPHYLLIVSSLLFDRDLDVRQDYARVAQGSPHAGARFRGQTLDHHAILVDRASGRAELWQRVFDWRRPRPCHTAGCVPFTRKSAAFPEAARAREVSAHPPAYPALVAALIAPFRPGPEQVERAVARANLLISLFAVVITYLTARRVGLGERHALAAAGLLGIASPWLVYAKSFYAEAAAGLVLVAGLRAMIGERPVLAGLAVALATAIKLPLALVAAGWVLERLLARRLREASLLALAAGSGIALLLLFNYASARTWLVAGSAGWLPADDASSLMKVLFHPSFGLVPFAPWALVAALWLLPVPAVAGRAAHRSLLRQIFWPMGLYLALLSLQVAVPGVWYGCRYWVPFLPWLALAAALRSAEPGPLPRAALAVLGVVGAAFAIPAALQYQSVWNTPAHRALAQLLSGG